MNLILYLAFNFCIYGYLGWALENLFSYFVNGKMQEEGFLNSPFKPMYAFAMTMLIYFNKRIDNDFMPSDTNSCRIYYWHYYEILF